MPQNSTRCWYFARHREVAQDQRPDEDVVDAEALLDRGSPTGTRRRGRRRTTTTRRARSRAPIDDPDGGLDRRLLRLDLVRLAVQRRAGRRAAGRRSTPSSDRPVPRLDVEVDEVRAVARRRAPSSRSSRTLTRVTAPRPHLRHRRAEYRLRSRRAGRGADDGLGGGQAGDRHAERRAAHVVEAGVVEQGDRLGVAAVLAAHAELELGLGRRGRAGRRCGRARRRRRRRSSRTGCASAGPARGRPASSGSRRRRG